MYEQHTWFIRFRGQVWPIGDYGADSSGYLYSHKLTITQLILVASPVDQCNIHDSHGVRRP
jgi:hypothetical protein